ncbi:alpha/beta hydrolase [Beijerinckia sp. GAS462]|nr:alpha/beta hydrolase [Beijerinckia sp. GAS462]
MRWLRYLLYLAAVAYLGAAAVLYFAQRQLLYVPNTAVAEIPAALPGAVSRQITTADRETLNAWYVPPADGKPILLYLHGNAGNLSGRTARFAGLTANGNGLLAIDWRGYGGSTGSPSEEGLMRDAEAAYAAALAIVGTPKRLIIVGESLGSGPAVALAARLASAGVILDAPYSSILDVASDRYWMFPVGLLLTDQFRSDLKIGEIKAPLLVMQGDQDRVVPIRFGEKLFALAPQPKEFIHVPGRGHLVLAVPDVMAHTLDWIDKIVNR